MASVNDARHGCVLKSFCLSNRVSDSGRIKLGADLATVHHRQRFSSGLTDQRALELDGQRSLFTEGAESTRRSGDSHSNQKKQIASGYHMQKSP